MVYFSAKKTQHLDKLITTFSGKYHSLIKSALFLDISLRFSFQLFWTQLKMKYLQLLSASLKVFDQDFKQVMFVFPLLSFMFLTSSMLESSITALQMV